MHLNGNSLYSFHSINRTVLFHPKHELSKISGLYWKVGPATVQFWMEHWNWFCPCEAELQSVNQRGNWQWWGLDHSTNWAL